MCNINILGAGERVKYRDSGMKCYQSGKVVFQYSNSTINILINHSKCFLQQKLNIATATGGGGGGGGGEWGGIVFFFLIILWIFL